MMVVLVAGWGFWQTQTRRAGTRTPVDALLVELLAPSVRLAGTARNALAPGGQAISVPTPVGQARQQQLELENRQLRDLLHLQASLPSPAIAAQVIGRSISPWQQFLTLDKGRMQGLAPRMVVLTPHGVLGQITAVTAHTATVLPLTDRASGIGAMAARGRAAGVLKGTGGTHCRMLYLSGQADIAVGDAVITSGFGHVFPKGYPLGSVTTVHPDPAMSTRVATIRPAADPATAEWVVVIGHVPAPEPQ